MYRFLLILGMALLWLDGPAFSKDKPKPPAISDCFGKICVTNLRWKRPNGFDSFDPYIEGVLVNGTAALLRSPSLTFTLTAGNASLGTAGPVESPDVPSGGQWIFRARVPEMISARYPVRTESVAMQELVLRGSRSWFVQET